MVCVLNVNFLSLCGNRAQVRKNLDVFSSPLFVGVRAASAKSPKSTATSHLDSSFSSFCILKHPKVFVESEVATVRYYCIPSQSDLCELKSELRNALTEFRNLLNFSLIM